MTSTGKNNEQGLNVIDLLAFFASKWKWFLLSVAICGGAAWLWYARTPFTYFSSATVIIKDPSNKTTTAAGLDRYDYVVNKVNVANEILQFRSKRLMREVVQRIHADVSYQVKDGLRYNELYTRSPVIVSFPGALPAQALAFTLTLKDKETAIVSGFEGADEEQAWEVKLNDTLTIEGSRIVVTPSNFFAPRWKGVDIKVRKSPVDAVAAAYQGGLGIRQEEDEASILTLSLKDSSPQRAEDVINTLIAVYNEAALKDKNQVAVNTANFINERLIIISQELGDVETVLETFRRENQVVSIEASANMYMSESQKYNTDAFELETQLRLAGYIKDYLTDPKNDTELIPANTGISDMNIENQIARYNTAKLQRDKLADESSESNPVVEELNNLLRATKQNIIRAVDNLIVSINVKRTDAQSRERRAQSRVAAIPTKERQMLSIERQQKIKESLYLFLLNRREENALSQAMADNNARIIDSAEATDFPIAPRRNRILLLGVLMGLAVPALWCLSLLFMDTRVRSRKDLEGVITVPYLGEIPLDRESGKKGKHRQAPAVYGSEGDIVTEAFRILRTNMQFMARHDRPMQVITFTSLNEGAGKTFISSNLAMSFVQAKKRVILIDLDIRRGTLSHIYRLQKRGMTNYLADASIAIDDIIQPQEKFDMIAAGNIAPNPAELLMDERLDRLIAELRRRYDYIVVDSVPVGIIADATIANRIADLTVFVARAGRLDRRQLPDIEQLYQEQKLRNMALVLNGADYRHRYGSQRSRLPPPLRLPLLRLLRPLWLPLRLRQEERLNLIAVGMPVGGCLKMKIAYQKVMSF